MGWYGPEGHSHDPNRYKRLYVCKTCGVPSDGEIVLGPLCPKLGCTWRPPDWNEVSK